VGCGKGWKGGFVALRGVSKQQRGVAYVFGSGDTKNKELSFVFTSRCLVGDHNAEFGSW
jgi:hypothetical protein